MGPKSKIVSVLRARFDAAFITDERAVHAAEYGIVDATMGFYSFVSPVPGYGAGAPAWVSRTGGDLMRHIAWPVLRLYNRVSQVKCVVVTADQSAHVAIAKGPEQQLRNEKRGALPLSVDQALLVPDTSGALRGRLIESQAPVPNWKQLCANGAAKAQCWRDLRALFRRDFAVPANRMLLLDGDLSPPNAHLTLLTAHAPGGAPTKSLLHDVGSSAPQPHATASALFDVRTWPNVTGEGDLRIFTLLTCVLPDINRAFAHERSPNAAEHQQQQQSALDASATSPNGRSVVVYFRDTDIVCLALFNAFDVLIDCDATLANLQRAPTTLLASALVFRWNMYIYNGEVMIDRTTRRFVCTKAAAVASANKRKAGTDAPGPTGLPATEFIVSSVLIRALAGAATAVVDGDSGANVPMTADERLRALGRFLRSAGMAGFVGGSDVNNSFANISQELFLDVYLDEFAEIGPICDLTAAMPPPTDDAPVDGNGDGDGGGGAGAASPMVLGYKAAIESLMGARTPVPLPTPSVAVAARVALTGYLELVGRCYARKYKIAGVDMLVPCAPTRQPFRNCDSGARGATCAWPRLVAAVTKRTPKSPWNRLPTTLELAYKLARFQWQCHYWARGWTTGAPLLPEAEFGFCHKDDPTRAPTTATDIRYCVDPAMPRRPPPKRPRGAATGTASDAATSTAMSATTASAIAASLQAIATNGRRNTTAAVRPKTIITIDDSDGVDDGEDSGASFAGGVDDVDQELFELEYNVPGKRVHVCGAMASVAK